jgi:hypothetical protein
MGRERKRVHTGSGTPGKHDYFKVRSAAKARKSSPRATSLVSLGLPEVLVSPRITPTLPLAPHFDRRPGSNRFS